MEEGSQGSHILICHPLPLFFGEIDDFLFYVFITRRSSAYVFEVSRPLTTKKNSPKFNNSGF
ncbi:MAG: hypothetical protein IPJ74_07730 [Saprospiraceae bacterium]|nr:hypothetical protein [Saprospiraceae bacterium]